MALTATCRSRRSRIGGRLLGDMFSPYCALVSRAPFSVQDVVQVVVMPCWHFLQAATH
jgi:hypothetical protein